MKKILLFFLTILTIKLNAQSNPTLSNFINGLSADEKTEINQCSNIDNSSLSSNGEDPNIKIEVKWRWFHGCHRPLGVCVIIEFSPTLGNQDGYSTETLTKMANNKIKITSTGLQNGVSSDGYLPIPLDFTLPSSVASQLGLNSITIQKGVYKATFDNSTNSYSSVVLNYQ